MAEWLNSVWLRLKAVARRRQMARDLADEMSLHLAMREEQLRAAGVAARELAAIPGVRSVALATDLPLTSYEHRAFTPEGAGAGPDGAPPTALTWVHGPYFETLGVRLARGRFFAPDESQQDRRVVVVNEKLASLVWPREDPVGRRLKWGAAASVAPWLTVVGVIGNVADGAIGAEPAVHAYERFRQLPDFFLNRAPNQFGRDLTAALLADGDPRALSGTLRREIAKLDPDLAIERISTMDEEVGAVLAPRRFGTLLVSAFAVVAVLLAAVGLYGLLVFTTGQRRREIAVRIALGAERSAVIGMVVGQGARRVAIGLVAGLLAALVTRVVAALLYQVTPYDPTALALIPAALGPAALAACALPAWRRAGRADERPEGRIAAA